MLSTDFSLYNNFATAVMVLDGSRRIVFLNHSFLRSFGNVKNLEKFSNYFNFDICILDSENLLSANPINFAIDSSESFTANAVFQSKENSVFYSITAFYSSEYKVIAFKNITNDLLFEESEKKYSFIRQQYLSLVEENKKYADLQQKAQTQTVKLALMNRVSNVIRESMDINKIFESALKELCNLFGAIKVYYASFDDNDFLIEHVYPIDYKDVIGEIPEFSQETKKNIHAKKIKVSSRIKDYLNSKITYPAPVTRIVVPVYKLHEILGILIIYTSQKYIDESQNDVLQSIATQLASAVVQASLFAQVNQKNEELEKTLEELKETQLQLINSEKLASLGQLVAGVAHEINTPLAAINANNGMSAKFLEKMSEDKDHFEQFFDAIKDINKIDKEAIKRISQIVQSLKKFVRLDESDLQFADINGELDLTLELIKHETKGKIEIEKVYSNIPNIKCYPNMLNQVFMNLLINACHSMPEGGKITIKTNFENHNLVVKIKDTGSGIDESIKDRLFIAGTTTKKVGIGTGLGLAISKKIIEKHHGQITFESESGKGTEFTVVIPDLSQTIDSISP